MLAPPIWIQRPIERHIRRCRNAIDNPLRLIEKNLPLNAADFSVFLLAFDPLPIDFFAENMKPHVLEPVPGIDPRPAAMRHAVRQCIPIRKLSLFHTVHYPNNIIGMSTMI